MVIWPLPRITFQELSLAEETRRVALLTSAETWPVVSDHLALPILIQAEPSRYDRELFEYLAENLPSAVEVVYAVGSGAPLEAAKVVAARNRVPLVVVPLALDSTSMLTPYTVATEPVADRQRRVRLSAVPAAEVIVDWDVILSAPESLRGAGIAEMLGIVTGLLDWRYAAQHGKNPRAERFQPWAAGVTTDLAKQAIKSATAIGQGDREALQTLLSLMMVAVQMGNLLGHARALQGGEHHLANILAATSNPATPQAELLGPCVLFCAALHGQDPAPLRDALSGAGVRLDQIRATDFNLMLGALSTHLADHGFPYSILNDLDPTADEVALALDAAGLVLLTETWAVPSGASPARRSAPDEEAARPARPATATTADTPSD
ncbi:MAG: iron-containing alcohol dehydrogenase [Anaerolineales bacterium]|nr:iron-containing alcohol dehydrogenase [Anaerolineales bacterium]